jgi:hypothetical protein
MMRARRQIAGRHGEQVIELARVLARDVGKRHL